MTTGMATEIDTITQLERKRCFFEVKGRPEEPLLVFVCGIHGNEPKSLEALSAVADQIRSNKIEIAGSVLGITGNAKALQIGERFIDQDLNRMWTSSNISSLEDNGPLLNEKKEMKEIWEVLKSNLQQKRQEDFVIYDLHTTSSPSAPFITINDTISNRSIAKSYPVATVFGIEEYLEGPLLSYMNELGYNAIGFEGGQHDDRESFYNHQAFIWLSLANHGLISESIPEVKSSKERLKKASKDSFNFFEITYRYLVKPGDRFKMQAGYTNFQSIKKDVELAVNNDLKIVSEWDDRIFMPLYQDKGDDGFFIIRRIPLFFLWLSRLLRKYNFEKFLLLLPGVDLYDKRKHVLKVNNKMVRFMRKEIFHLLGFRQKVAHDELTTLYIRRERQ